MKQWDNSLVVRPLPQSNGNLERVYIYKKLTWPQTIVRQGSIYSCMMRHTLDFFLTWHNRVVSTTTFQIQHRLCNSISTWRMGKVLEECSNTHCYILKELKAMNQSLNAWHGINGAQGPIAQRAQIDLICKPIVLLRKISQYKSLWFIQINYLQNYFKISGHMYILLYTLQIVRARTKVNKLALY